MRKCVRASMLAVCLSACPAATHAQSMAVSFADLPRVLKVGTVVYVTDTAGVTTWGSVEQMSESSLTISIMQARIGDGIARNLGKRVFAKESLARVSRSSESGREEGLIYPASWARVTGVPSGADVMVVLETGEKRRLRFGSATADSVRLLEAGGREQSIPRATIREIIRRGVGDSSTDGFILGAVVGAVAAVLPTAVMLGLDDSDRGRGLGSSVGIAAAAGGGIGAAIGWSIDRLRKGHERVFPAPPARAVRIDVTPVIAPRQRSLTLSIAF